jgi:hypothetical protein
MTQIRQPVAMRQAPVAGSEMPSFDEILKYMGQAPVTAPEAGFIKSGGEELKEQTFYPGVIASGTGIDAEKRPGPVEVTTVTGPILEIDPDALIGGPGGVKYSELRNIVSIGFLCGESSGGY